MAVATPEPDRVILSPNPRAYEYLLYGIVSARSLDELARMRRLARAHYTGSLLVELETEIDARSDALRQMRAPALPPLPAASPAPEIDDEPAVKPPVRHG